MDCCLFFALIVFGKHLPNVASSGPFAFLVSFHLPVVSHGACHVHSQEHKSWLEKVTKKGQTGWRCFQNNHIIFV